MGLAKAPEPDKEGPRATKPCVTRVTVEEKKRKERLRNRPPARQLRRPLLQQAGTKRRAGR